MSNKSVVLEFIETWHSLDADKIGAFFADDGVYYNMPADPVKGKEAVIGFIKGFTADWTATTWDVITIVEEGDTVIAERVDHIDIGDKHCDLPCVGVFEMEGGKIKEWRDFFDLGTYMKAFG